MKQRSIAEYIKSPADPMKDYKIQSTDWLTKSSPVSKRIRSKKNSTRAKSKSKTKNKTCETPVQNCTTEVNSPLEKWIQRKRSDSPWDRFKELAKHNQTQQNAKNDTNTSKPKKKLKFCRNDSFEKYGVVLPTVDQILNNMDTIRKEGKILDEYDKLYCESDIAIPTSLKTISDSPEKTIPLLSCEHLSQFELDKYVIKYLDYLKDISKGVEYSQRHETYNKHNSKSKLTFSFSMIVYKESQLEYLTERIEELLDPEGKRTEYLFMVILPELCLKIFMNEFEMSKTEAVDYLNRRPVD